jgi:hypothetical protein
VLSAPVLADGTPAEPDPDGSWEEFSLKFTVLRSTKLVVGGRIKAALKIGLPSPAGGFALKPDGSSISVDLNGDGRVDTKAKEGRPVFLQVQHDDGARAKYAVRFYRGPRMGWTYETASAMAGRVGGEAVKIVDGDCNGKYDDVGKDAVFIGRQRWGMPLGRVIVLKDKLYHVKVDPRGASVSLQPYAGKTGKIDLTRKFRAPGKLQYAVVQCGEAYFDASARGGVEVPAGKYALLRARLEKGRQSCHIVRGKMKEIEVASGGKTEPEWGPPLRIEFQAKVNKKKIHIAARLHYYGKADEEYVDFENVVSTPEVMVRSSDGAVASKGRFSTG